ncbi:hypothetical protein L596_027751 [Steinernema carpocapsae]|uniref:Uncharacterized protein n=1 Tax=Steinernema carpocapsae TaxID=34508 RepID=A0A4V5ZXN4_STECR|nr:hypothetical protein L596_027751 [Steinernema carpocapsae]
MRKSFSVGPLKDNFPFRNHVYSPAFLTLLAHSALTKNAYSVHRGRRRQCLVLTFFLGPLRVARPLFLEPH